MTTIHPQPRFNVIRKYIRPRPTRRPCRKVPAAVIAADISADVTELSNEDSTDAGFCGEPFADNGELLSSLSPLLFSMKLFGLYFHREDPHRRRTDDPEWNPATTTTRTSSNRLRVYATVVLILVWLNAFRFVSVFSKSDNGAALLMKIAILAWFGLVAITYTAHYVASHTGQLVEFLSTIPVTSDCVNGARRAVIILTTVCWLSAVMDVVAGGYLIFGSTYSGEYDFLFAPFVTHIDAPEDIMTTVRVIGYLGHIYIFPSVFYSHAVCAVLVYILYNQYEKLEYGTDTVRIVWLRTPIFFSLYSECSIRRQQARQ